METDIPMAVCEDSQGQLALSPLEESWFLFMCDNTVPFPLATDNNLLASQGGFMQPSESSSAFESGPYPFSSTPDSSYESSANVITPGSVNSSYSVTAPPDSLYAVADPSAALSFTGSGMQRSQTVSFADPMFPEGSVENSFAEFDFNAQVALKNDLVLRAFPPLDDPSLDVAASAFYALEASGVTAITGTPITLNPPSVADMFDEVEGNSQQPPSLNAPHVCSTCSRGFKNKGSLHKHEKTHTRPHICLICGERQGAKRDTIRHMWAQHPKEAAEMDLPPVKSQCPHCSKTGRDDNIKRHIRTQH